MANTKVKIAEKRVEREAYRKSREELSRIANNPDDDPLIKDMARAHRKDQKKKMFAGDQ